MSENNSVSVFKPSIDLKLGDRTVTVREMNWRDAMEFLKRLSRHAGSLVDDKGNLALRLDKLSDITINAQDLSEFLIVSACTDVSLESLKALPFHEALEILDAALQVNLTPQILGNAKKAGERFGAALGVRKAPPTIPTRP